MKYRELGCRIQGGTTLCLFNNPNDCSCSWRPFLKLEIGAKPYYPLFSEEFEDSEVLCIYPDITPDGDPCLCVLLDCEPEKPETPAEPAEIE